MLCLALFSLFLYFFKYPFTFQFFLSSSVAHVSSPLFHKLGIDDIVLCSQVECKKAQPKEVVQAANTAALLGKRVILGNLGMMPSLTMLPQLGGALSPAAPQPLTTPSLHAALQQQLAASIGTVVTPRKKLYKILSCRQVYTGVHHTGRAYYNARYVLT
jgi:hypothetical protein